MMITQEEQKILKKEIQKLRDSRSRNTIDIQQWDLQHDKPIIEELVNIDEYFYRDFIQIFEYQDYFLDDGIQTFYGMWDRGVYNFVVDVLSGKQKIQESTDICYDFIQPAEDSLKYLFSVLIFVINNRKEVHKFISKLYTDFWGDDPFPESITRKQYIDIVVDALYKNTNMSLYKKEIKNQLISALDLSSYILQLIKKYTIPQQEKIIKILLMLHDKMNSLYKIL